MNNKIIIWFALILNCVSLGCGARTRPTSTDNMMPVKACNNIVITSTDSTTPVNKIAHYYQLDVKAPSNGNRARLAQDFPKLEPRIQYLVLAYLWPQARCQEFVDALLPLADLPKVPEQANEDTLCDQVFIRLLELRPETVRPIILKDIQQPNPYFSLSVLLALPDQELPELDEVLLAHLNTRNNGIWKVAPLIERYATARIFPEVIAFYQSPEQRWACSLQTAILRYWLKHDRPAALQAIERAVNFRRSTYCYKSVLGETLHDSFDAEAEKLARKFVNDSDAEVAADANRLLTQHVSAQQRK